VCDDCKRYDHLKELLAAIIRDAQAGDPPSIVLLDKLGVRWRDRRAEREGATQ
jgi:hypothetical protein